ncbi:septation regulator SpoVG [Peptoniphilus equinus]|uniref:Putative septation protein SpoVG n=1 Tax=Peptoniphilus equinus TaxID=3016343 RepID=A0ABY7QVI2_9FIRM|nr:septation regulator SpoVG [Peptoniphilus equinus]WBW50727.1 septation regulator SpoVG [Peptoniphilus equinus]
MNITDVRIKLLPDPSKMKAVVSVTFDDQIAIHDIKIIEGANSLFMAMPSRKLPNGEYKDVAHPINASTRKALEDAVFAAYDDVLSQHDDEPI